MTKRCYGDPEQKFVVNAKSDTAFETAWGNMSGASGGLCIPAGGSDQSEAGGRTYFITNLKLKLGCKHNTLTGAGPVGDISYRVCLIWDKQTRATEMVPADCMAGVAKPWLGFKQLINEHRFQILYDSGHRILKTNSFVDVAGTAYITPFNFDSTCDLDLDFNPPIKVVTDGTDGVRTITNVIDNSLHLIGAARLVTVLYDYRVKVRFTDRAPC